MSSETPCNRFVVPWDEQQGFHPERDEGDANAKCETCKRTWREHKRGTVSSETLDERLADLAIRIAEICNERGPTDAVAMLLAERADAERVQRVLAGAARQETERMRQAWMVQRERAERAEAKGACACDTAGLNMAVICAKHSLLIDSATRPYRMAIARWAEAFNRGGEALGDASLALRSLITDADIEAARKEDGRE